MYSNTFCIHCLFTSSIASTIDLKKEVLLGRLKNVPVGAYERVNVIIIGERARHSQVCAIENCYTVGVNIKFP